MRREFYKKNKRFINFIQNFLLKYINIFFKLSAWNISYVIFDVYPCCDVIFVGGKLRGLILKKLEEEGNTILIGNGESEL